MRQVPLPARPGGTATGVTSPGNTAEPSGELPVGDLVAVGEAVLVCERAWWAPLRGPITEVRLDDHGTHPLPASSPDRQGMHPAGQKEGGAAHEPRA